MEDAESGLNRTRQTRDLRSDYYNVHLNCDKWAEWTSCAHSDWEPHFMGAPILIIMSGSGHCSQIVAETNDGGKERTAIQPRNLLIKELLCFSSV